MLETLKAFYGALGAPHPVISLIIASLIGAVFGFLIWSGIGLLYEKDANKSIVENVNNEFPIARPKNAEASSGLIISGQDGFKAYGNKIEGYDTGVEITHSHNTEINDSQVSGFNKGVKIDKSPNTKLNRSSISKKEK